MLGLVGHEIEAGPDVLHRAADDAQRPQLFARVVQLDRELETLAHDVGRDPVAVVDALRLFEPGERLPIECGAFVARGGGVVGELVVVARDARVGRRDRVERGVCEHVFVRDVVDL